MMTMMMMIMISVMATVMVVVMVTVMVVVSDDTQGVCDVDEKASSKVRLCKARPRRGLS